MDLKGDAATLLRAELGLSQRDVKALAARHPEALRDSVDTASVDALAGYLGLRPAQTKRLVLHQPSLLRSSWVDNLEPKLLNMQRELELSLAEARQLVLASPGLLAYSWENKIQPTLNTLRTELELQPNELKRIFLRHSQVVGLSAKGTLVPRLRALAERLELDRPALRKIIVSMPPILSYSYERKMKTTLDRLQRDLRLTNEELRRVVLVLPSLLGYSYEENLGPKLSFLRSEFALTTSDLRREVLRTPILLGASLHNSLRPNLELWRQEAPALDLRTQLFKHNSRFLQCSYARRTQPRFEQARQLGVPIDELLPRMGLTNERFELFLQKHAGARRDEAEGARLLVLDGRAESEGRTAHGTALAARDASEAARRLRAEGFDI